MTKTKPSATPATTSSSSAAAPPKDSKEANPPTRCKIRLSEIKFSQASISRSFRDRRPITELRDALRSQHPDELLKETPIEVVKHRDQFVTMDNRRLWCMKNAIPPYLHQKMRVSVLFFESANVYDRANPGKNNAFDFKYSSLSNGDSVVLTDPGTRAKVTKTFGDSSIQSYFLLREGARVEIDREAETLKKEHGLHQIKFWKTRKEDQPGPQKDVCLITGRRHDVTIAGVMIQEKWAEQPGVAAKSRSRSSSEDSDQDHGSDTVAQDQDLPKTAEMVSPRDAEDPFGISRQRADEQAGEGGVSSSSWNSWAFMESEARRTEKMAGNPRDKTRRSQDQTATDRSKTGDRRQDETQKKESQTSLGEAGGEAPTSGASVADVESSEMLADEDFLLSSSRDLTNFAWEGAGERASTPVSCGEPVSFATSTTCCAENAGSLVEVAPEPSSAGDAVGGADQEDPTQAAREHAVSNSSNGRSAGAELDAAWPESCPALTEWIKDVTFQTLARSQSGPLEKLLDHLHTESKWSPMPLQQLALPQLLLNGSHKRRDNDSDTTVILRGAEKSGRTCCLQLALLAELQVPVVDRTGTPRGRCILVVTTDEERVKGFCRTVSEWGERMHSGISNPNVLLKFDGTNIKAETSSRDVCAGEEGGDRVFFAHAKALLCAIMDGTMADTQRSFDLVIYDDFDWYESQTGQVQHASSASSIASLFLRQRFFDNARRRIVTIDADVLASDFDLLERFPRARVLAAPEDT